MSIEEAIIARARPAIFEARIREVLGHEVSKGCSGEVSAEPVCLEPDFVPINDLLTNSTFQATAIALHESIRPQGEWQRLRVWISPDQAFDWIRSEAFLKQLAGCSHRVSFELIGNREEIKLMIGAFSDDFPIIRSAFDGQFAHCRLMPCELYLPEGGVSFADYFPGPPYFHLLTAFEEFKTSPLESLVCAISDIDSDSVGLYQCVFQSVNSNHNWHRNVELLHDLEFRMSLQSGFGFQSTYAQQVPSGDLKVLASELDRKAHNDKPFFAAAVRIGFFGDQRHATYHMPALSAFMRLFQHGGKSLKSITQKEYRPLLLSEGIRDLVCNALVHRTGFLVNSRELCGLAHIFASSLFENRNVGLPLLETLPVKNSGLRQGTVIGYSTYGEQEEDVCIPPLLRSCGTHVLACPGMGKSTVMMNMFLQDITEGMGAVFIDAHGDAVQHLMGVMPQECEERCVYFEPGDSEWVPSWNPLFVPEGNDRYRMADDFLSALKRVSQHWGDRLAHVLRNGLIALSFLQGSTLKDLYHLVRPKSRESEELRARILESDVDDAVRAFWEHDFLKDYRAADLASPKHKLDPLIVGGSVSLMLSQPSSKIQFRQIMDEQKVLLVNLSSLGSEAREVLGSLILTLFMIATISRSDTLVSERRSFSIFADEAHLFVAAGAIEGIIAQARKFGVGLCIAHQYLNQFEASQKDALSTVGTTILGRLDKRDADYFAKDLQDLVKPKDLVALKPFEMIARIRSDVVRIKTHRGSLTESEETRGRIIERSRNEYCVSANSIRNEGDPVPARSRHDNRSIDSAIDYSQVDLSYDEF